MAGTMGIFSGIIILFVLKNNEIKEVFRILTRKFIKDELVVMEVNDHNM